MLAQDFEDVGGEECDFLLSQEDRRALHILNNTVRMEDGHYSVGLLWKNECRIGSDGRDVAERRREGLTRRFKKNPDLYQKYCSKMTEYISNFAEPVPLESESNGRCRYIPHHCTAAETKFRVVFDCSARSGDGKSLNDMLMRGPDLTNTVVGVLLRFRQNPIAVVADIMGMFSQVLVEEADREALRFLWYPDNDYNQPPVCYRMRTHVFGAKSSPCCAAFALRMTGVVNATGACEGAVNAVLKSVYVDDVCLSCVSEKEAIDLVAQLRPLLASGGFHLTKRMSNSKAVLEQIPPEDLVGDVSLAEELPVHKTLGVFWDASTDRLKVRVNIKEKPCTRRGLLSMISQTYNPLGILQPFLLPARRLLQQACVSKLGWDAQIDSVSGLERDWDCWFASLCELEQVELARCVLPHGQVARIELHTFADASTVGYGACTYLRVVYRNGSVHCSLILGKSRVVPLKRVSMPRLELVAAVLAAKLCKLIRKELDVNVDEVFYWTDATVVLRYISNSFSRFEAFVGNRIELLHTLTAVSQWRYVPTNDNPADLASRGISPKLCVSAELWFRGPSFLLCNDSVKWPEQPDFMVELAEDDPEVKNTLKKCFSQKILDEGWVERVFTRYSDLTRLRRTMAWLLRFHNYVRWKFSDSGRNVAVGPLTAEECEKALAVIIQLVQDQSFSEALRVLPNQVELAGPAAPVTEEMIKKSSHLQQMQHLNPFVVRGSLRVGGRLRNARLSYEAKYPLLMPHQHPVTDLLIKHHHEKEGQMGVNHVLAGLNRNVWIVNGRSAVKRVIGNCVPCRTWRARSGNQQMGDLPPARVQQKKPFTSIGVDLMGPIMVTVGRSLVKRYICIFNCMVTRAVHFEVVQSQEVRVFLQAYRRFCGRRNVNPTSVYSDNGGNFVAAEKVLKGKVTWHFNPPRASHQGGLYEIFFKLFRKIFRSIVSGSILYEFDLFTYVTEVERILNNRPITKLPDTPDDWAALTPNSILTGSLADDVQLGRSSKVDVFRQSWKTEYLADQFWRQWLQQYLPLLHPRQKWFGVSCNVKPGDLVLMLDESLPRGQWPKAIVVENLPDQGGLVRRVRVRTSGGTIYSRDIRKLCLLEGLVE